MKSRFFLVILFLMFFFSVESEAQELMTLKNAISLALKNHPSIAISRNNAKIAGNNANIGNAGLLPRVGLNGSANYYDDEAASVMNRSTRLSMSIQANYTFFDGFGNVYLYKKLQSGKKISRLEARNSIESSLIEISQLFYHSAMAYDYYLVAQELLDISRERLLLTKKGVELGSIGKIEMLSAEIDFNSDSVTCLRSRLSWNQTVRELNVLLGREPHTQLVIDTSVVYKNIDEIENYRLKMLDNNAALLLARERIKQNQYSVKEAWSDFAPVFDLSASYGLGQINPDFDLNMSQSSRTINIGITAYLNLFNGNKNVIQANNASIQLNNQEIMHDYTLLSLKNELESLYEIYINSKMVLELEKNNLKVAELNFQRSKELYYLGRLTSIRFREAQINLARIRSSFYNAKYELKINELKLQQITGELLDSYPN